ncbi:hypothetical protein DPMN_044951 [Dreissena polymorpha]|uniref:Uncharacterized protein n=1 Tax=Dreissena polymorpha TaxID=45954 RepID=A0A9D4D6T1_DREPO|nr:hypothetical protein DPMN_044951 [Dreissena polymorpha]
MVAFLNRYMAAYLCLGQDHNVGVTKNLKYSEDLLALEGERTCNASGVPHLVINVADEKLPPHMTVASQSIRTGLMCMMYVTDT